MPSEKLQKNPDLRRKRKACISTRRPVKIRLCRLCRSHLLSLAESLHHSRSRTQPVEFAAERQRQHQACISPGLKYLFASSWSLPGAKDGQTHV